jgi:hypothetical protein
MLALALVLSAALAGAPKTAANKPTQLKLDIQPDTAVVFVDGKKKGKGGKLITLAITPGNHIVKIVNNKDEHEEQVSVKKGEQKTFQWEFEDDLEDRRKAAEEKKKAEKSDDDADEKVETPKKVDSDAVNEDDILAPKKKK